MTGRVAPLVATGLALALLAAAAPERVPRLAWNASASVPIGLYALRPPNGLVVGDLVAVRLPDEVTAWMAARGYLGAGALLLKRVAALPGAQVCRCGGAILIDGVTVAGAATTDSAGRALPTWRGCRRLAEGEVFLLVPDAPGSLDGRYLGELDAAAIVGRAHPIWTRSAAR